MSERRSAQRPEVLSNAAIAAWGIGLVLLGLISIIALWVLVSSTGPEAGTRLDAIRTAFSIVLGGGGAAGLLLTARKQRSTELDIEIKSHDSAVARVTELYGRAADQLGSDKAPVRLAGIFALERLAQGNPEHRQTIVDLLCAYLRMPAATSGADDTDPALEREVRETAQLVLTAHLRADEDTAELFWPDIRLNLAGAVLSTFRFTRCRVRRATFAGARFDGAGVFRGAVFEQQADFRSARFTGLADFRRVGFDGQGANFRDALFAGEVDFGTHTETTLTDASATPPADGVRRKWPAGWCEEPDGERHVLVRSGNGSSGSVTVRDSMSRSED
ncbi:MULTISPECIES: pentapeptide repeat-containing protein [unclassified Saccharopolyspora]|uniref:pentapeptide repeat-containing protein n=1 Tax=unclassified Saccharopolyspora TaxID=2646250 RepID=UPI001CD47315|nr:MULTISPECIES: pentapeptide repeat-containing protein [unclassified Saccharopolyspora]MCA1193143.1 pentapeptide repeat-containing protein [Saccharopolyspora sp. 6V]MCA1224552.1 pentapeptide repeat-containing protein [Saccharopolyspora sp. 6M]MCA1279023.1 pentapeptide repeat-containing protein [Saccharopolyspora sp. 7B]